MVASGKITLGFYLTTLKVFGTLTGWAADKWCPGTTSELYVADINEVPLPAAAWLFGSALFGLAGLRRRKVSA